MAAQAEFEDSNIALLGSDLEKEVRKKAAETVEAYKGAGQCEGIEIWRIEKFKVVPWPKPQYGSFYNGDSFICLHTYKPDPEAEKLAFNIHFWLGGESTQDEMGVAAYMTVVLDDLLGTIPVQYREVEGYESEEFLSLWSNKGGIRLLQGGVDSGFNHVKAAEYKPRLLHVKGTKKSMRVTEVPLASSSMNQGDVFLLDNGLELVQWEGDSAGVFEKRRAKEIMDTLREERNYKAKGRIVTGLDDDETLWDLCGDKGGVQSKEAGGADDAKQESYTNKLYRLSDASGDLKTSEEGSGALKKASLDSADVFIVDLGHQLFVWVGSGASKNERRKGMKYATDFLTQSGRPLHTPIIKVVEGAENRAFHQAFAG